MINKIKNTVYNLLKKSESWTKTDMIYIAKGSFWMTIGQFVSSISFFLLSLAFANFLSVETYGSYKYILSIFSLLTLFTMGSMSTAISQAVARGYEGSLVSAIKTKIKWGLLGGILSLGISVYYYLNNDQNLAVAFLIISFFVPIFRSFALYTSFLQGKKMFKTSTKYGTINNFINTTILILTIFLTNNLYLILLAHFIPKNITNFIAFFLVKKKHQENKKEDPKSIPFGVYLTLISTLSIIAVEIDKILLWHYLGATELAIFSFAVAPVSLVSSLVSKNLSTLSMPKLSEKPIQVIKQTLPKKVVKFYIFLIPVIILYIFFSPLFFKIFYPQYLSSIWYSQLYSLTLILIPITFFGNTFTAQMKKKEITIAKIISPTIKISLLLLLTPIYGILGVILAQIIFSIFHICLISFLFFKMKTN